jgi:hypothetical protein
MQTTRKLLSSLGESKKLTYEKQITLKALSGDGLTEEMLLNREGYFDYCHYEALCQLVKKGGFTIQAALKEIEGVSRKQAGGIRDGLAREDVISLENYWYIEALVKLKQHGLTPAMLLNQNNRWYEGFGSAHRDSLCHLVKKGLTIQASLKEIEGLYSCQAHGIEEGLTRDDVMPLFNCWQVIALAKLKSFGLTNEMLLKQTKYWDGLDDSNYCYALIRLVENKKFTIQAALTEIENLSSYQARGIQYGLIREDVISLENFWHINVLIELKQHGLTPEMLLNRNDGEYNFDSDHCYALRDLVKEKKFNIQAALKKIEGISCAEARQIREGHLLNNKDLSADHGLSRRFS